MNVRPITWLITFSLLFVFSLGSGCQTVYYDTLEKFGVHKHDILTDRVKGARDSQEEAKEQFRSVLENFSAVVNFEGGDLQQKYDTLRLSFERSELRAKEVSERIASVERVSKAMFKEWRTELKHYANANLRNSSERQLVDTKKQYDVMMKAMRHAEKKMDPVLSAFRDQVLFLKHNLNARAMASLATEVASVETDIGALIRGIESSIREADSFVQSMGK